MKLLEAFEKLPEMIYDKLKERYYKLESLFNSLFLSFLSLILAFSISFLIQSLFILLKEVYPEKYLNFVLNGFYISLGISFLVVYFISLKLFQLRKQMDMTSKQIKSWKKTNMK